MFKKNSTFEKRDAIHWHFIKKRIIINNLFPTISLEIFFYKNKIKKRGIVRAPLLSHYSIEL